MMDMMDDRTQHVIDAIDGALDDWSVSGDAMRWTPEQPGPAAPLHLPASRIFFAPAGTPPPTDPTSAHEWVEVEPGQPGFRGGRRPVTLGLHPWQAAVLAQTYGSAFREAAEAVSRAMNALPDDVDHLLAAIEGLRPLAPEPAEREDPRARALRLRRHRNTGPASDVTRQRRPRHHLSAGSSTRTARR